MKYFHLKTTDPYYNLAVEEYLLKNTEEDVFMLWQNAPTVVIGKNQNAYAEVDIAYARAHGIRIARRLSGGGAVYHDAGNLNYTFITSESKAKALDYAYFTQPIISALATIGIPAVLSGRNDLECEGKKFSGNAQYVSGGRVLHHGTLLFDTDLSVMSSVLRTDKEKLALRAVPSHKGRVLNLATRIDPPMTVTEFTLHIEHFALSTFAICPSSPPVAPEIDALARRNGEADWIFSDKRYLTEYSVVRKRRYPFGTVELSLSFRGNAIARVRITGDFFGTRPTEELEASLVGMTPDTPLSVDPYPYIAGMDESTLKALLFCEENQA